MSLVRAAFWPSQGWRERFKQIKRFLPGSSVSIIAYCLMPNHYHFLFRSEADDAIGRFIQRLFNTYTQAFNRRRGRSGTLFEARAKSVEVDDEPYAPHLCRYIHLNPVAAGLVKQPDEYAAFVRSSVEDD